MRCWWCGVEPIALHEITRFGDSGPRHLPHWPDGDHTPGQLEQAGHETLMRIRHAASTVT